MLKRTVCLLLFCGLLLSLIPVSATTTINIVKPIDGMVLFNGYDLTVVIQASEVSGDIEVYANNDYLGTATQDTVLKNEASGIYSYEWENLPVGNYALTAKNNGVTSEAVSITVNACRMETLAAYDFEDYAATPDSPGNPTNWSFSAASGTYSPWVKGYAEVAGDGTRHYRVDLGNTTSVSNTLTLPKTFTGKSEVEFSFMALDDNSSLLLRFGAVNGAAVMFLPFGRANTNISSQSIVVGDLYLNINPFGNATPNRVPLMAGFKDQWIDCKIVADWEAMWLDIYINGVKYITQHNFATLYNNQQPAARPDFTQLKYFRFDLGCVNQGSLEQPVTASFLFDDFIVTTYTDAPAAKELNFIGQDGSVIADSAVAPSDVSQLEVVFNKSYAGNPAEPEENFDADTDKIVLKMIDGDKNYIIPITNYDYIDADKKYLLTLPYELRDSVKYVLTVESGIGKNGSNTIIDHSFPFTVSSKPNSLSVKQVTYSSGSVADVADQTLTAVLDISNTGAEEKNITVTAMLYKDGYLETVLVEPSTIAGNGETSVSVDIPIPIDVSNTEVKVWVWDELDNFAPYYTNAVLR